MRAIPYVLLTALVLGCSGNGGNGDGDPDASTHCTPLTENGICNVIEQCGCEEGSWCGMALDDSTCEFFEDCFWAPPGGTRVEGQCYEPFQNRGECRPGMDCLWVEDMYSNRCHEWCETDDDCSVEGRTCSWTITLSTMYCSSVTAPVQVCDMSF